MCCNSALGCTSMATCTPLLEVKLTEKERRCHPGETDRESRTSAQTLPLCLTRGRGGRVPPILRAEQLIFQTNHEQEKEMLDAEEDMYCHMQSCP